MIEMGQGRSYGATLIKTLTGLSSNISIVITGIVFLIILVSIGVPRHTWYYIGILGAMFVTMRDADEVGLSLNFRLSHTSVWLAQEPGQSLHGSCLPSSQRS